MSVKCWGRVQFLDLLGIHLGGAGELEGEGNPGPTVPTNPRRKEPRYSYTVVFTVKDLFLSFLAFFALLFLQIGPIVWYCLQRLQSKYKGGMHSLGPIWPWLFSVLVCSGYP